MLKTYNLFYIFNRKNAYVLTSNECSLKVEKLKKKSRIIIVLSMYDCSLVDFSLNNILFHLTICNKSVFKNYTNSRNRVIIRLNLIFLLTRLFVVISRQIFYCDESALKNIL